MCFKLLSGDGSFFAAGKAMIVSLGKGILSMVSWPFTVLRDMVRRIFGIFTDTGAFGEAGKGH